ncbi:MAG: MFS transporter [Planctomycetota bacterium]
MLTTAHRELLADPGFRRLWAATSISELGSNVGRMAFILLVHELARASGDDPERDVALVMLLETLPMLCLGPVAGAVVDRFDRRRLLIGCDIAAGLLLLAIPWLAALPTRAPLFAIAMVFSTISTVFHPARQSAIPDLVPPDRLADANGLSTITSSVNLLLGTALGGFLIGAVGKNGCFVADSAGFAVSIAFLMRLTLPRHNEPARHAGELWGEVGKGLRYLARHRMLVYTTGNFFLTYCFVGAWYPVLPAFVEETLGGAPDVWVPLSLACFGIGGGVGGVLAPRLARRLRLGRALLLLLLLLTVALPVYALTGARYASLLLAAVGGTLIFATMVLDTTLVHEEVPAGMRGRIFGTRAPMQAAGILAGTSAVLSLAEGRAPQTLLAGASAAYAVLLLSSAALHPGARALWRREEPPDDAEGSRRAAASATR